MSVLSTIVKQDFCHRLENQENQEDQEDQEDQLIAIPRENITKNKTKV
ncbi:MAG TPA: hypothetical protein VFR94_25585 [Nitrososphaeraceae archaeon]|nr:hypothetical protein [Nitrososphaeraceae archaeon]